MKKFYAFSLNNGSSNSGVTTEVAAKEWAAKELANKPNLQFIYIAEVIEQARRVTPTIEVMRYEPERSS